jgi:HrpA-like RNA helicase
MYVDPNRMWQQYGRHKQFATNGGDEQEGLAMAMCTVSSIRVFTTTTWKSGSSRSFVFHRAAMRYCPQALMKKCIDPPPEAHVADAIEYLKKVGACREASEFCE